MQVPNNSEEGKPNNATHFQKLPEERHPNSIVPPIFSAPPEVDKNDRALNVGIHPKQHSQVKNTLAHLGIVRQNDAAILHSASSGDDQVAAEGTLMPMSVQIEGCD